MGAHWDTLWMALGELLSPARCAACDERLERRALLCPVCAATVERWRGSGQPFAFGHYGGALASTVLRLKYGGRPDLAVPLGLLLLETLSRRTETGSIEVVVPVPTPTSRLVTRGYNQAALLARPLVRHLGAKFAPCALGRREGGDKQAALGRGARLQNLRNAMFVRDPRAIAGRRVLLVDDVSTTGATVDACKDAMHASGAQSVHAVVVARVEPFADPIE